MQYVGACVQGKSLYFLGKGQSELSKRLNVVRGVALTALLTFAVYMC